MARHANSRGRERHLIPRIGIGVALPASQPERDMRLVAVWQRLRGRGVGRDIIGHLLFSGRRLLRGGTQRDRKQDS
jgi:hypothetical protein